MLKILQARLQRYVNDELPDVQAGFRKGRGTRDQIVNICFYHWKSKGVPEKLLLLLYWLCQSLWLCGLQKSGKFFRRWEYQTTLNASWEIYADQEAILWNWTWNNRLVPNWERSTSRLYIVSLVINLYAEYIMKNAWLVKPKLESRLPREINSLRYADDTMLMVES